ncbi:hypothetical protein M3I54_00185 [Paraburkholderia sp. CNPSo 3274]|uniref:hypothetical protein n=1 Tax=Paraburkholderia sp. CNPSo 3274 TaxID=2940932 RepID=UPI0020B8287E|nr:hypothetical protein [Paraburkholderia sp. CNPSo 3274]MCP3705423.1 hypothetical protein [Paraburkholderia sp. CNPSo 3274]
MVMKPTPSLPSSGPGWGVPRHDVMHWRARRDTGAPWRHADNVPQTTAPRDPPRAIDLHIDTLVLDGFATSQRARVVRALRAELDLLCVNLSRLGTDLDARSWRSAAAQFVQTGAPDADGRAIARAIFRALRLDESERPGERNIAHSDLYGGD